MVFVPYLFPFSRVSSCVLRACIHVCGKGTMYIEIEQKKILIKLMLFPTLQAVLNHTSKYVAVGTSYQFQADAALGTNVTLDWYMENGTVEQRFYGGNFTGGILDYTFVE